MKLGTMKFWDKFAYYGGFCGLVIAIGGIIAMAVTGSTLMIGKMILALILCASLFSKGLHTKRLIAARQTPQKQYHD